MDDLRGFLVNQPDTAIARLVRAFALPKEFGDGVRLASEGSGIKTATGNLTVQYNAANWASAVADTRLPAADMMAFLFNNILRGFVYYDHNPTAAVMTYAAQFTQGAASVACYHRTTTKIQPRYYTPTLAYRPHGSILFCGEDNGELYTPLDQGNSMFATLNPAPATVNGAVTFWLWDGKRAVPVANYPFVIAQANYPHVALVSGDYFCTVTNNEGVDLACSSAINGSSPVWCHSAVDDIEEFLTIAAGTRINFASCKIMNTANDQDKNGREVSLTVSSAIPWRQFATGYNAATGLEGFVSRPAEEGGYVFNIPDSDNDIDEFYDDITFGGFPGGLSQASYPLSERQPYKMIALNIPTAAGRAITFEVTHCPEFLTNGKLSEKDISPFTPGQVSAAVQILRTMSSDYANDTHLGDILATVGKYLPRSADSLSKLFRLFSSDSLNVAADYLESRSGSIQEFGKSLQSYKKKKR
jgi:hypothetical protein